MVPGDWPAVKKIYEEGITTGQATFEKEAPDWSAWDQGHLPEGRLVLAEEEEILGWAALSPVSSRCIYAGVAEVSIYMTGASRGKGLGYTLLQKLVEISEQQQLWTLQAGIFPENTASVKIHDRAGFRMVGKRDRIGRLNGFWRDNLLMERRSNKVGI